MKVSAGRGVTILVGIGLVLVGLLGGILFMLAVDDGEEGVQEPRIVDRVEIGGGDRVWEPAPEDSGEVVAMPEPSTINNMFREVADRVTPAVVYIEIEMEESSAGSRFRQFEEELPEEFFPDQMPQQSVGSGVIISEDGYIVTNYHVVQRAETIHVTLADKRQFEAEMVGADPSTDLAVLRIDDASDISPIALGNSDRLGVGDWVVAVGNPFRLTSTVTSGIVSALGRQMNIIRDQYRIEDFIQTDAAINPGNSGGALVNMNAELIGINTAIATESGSYEGYGFAVPTNLMERVVTDLIAYGEVRRGFMGVSIEDIDADRAEALGLDRIMGVYVPQVHDGGAAAAAGLRDGDVVLEIEEQSVDATNELQTAVAHHRPGDVISVTVWRDGTTQTLNVQLEGREDWTPEDGAPEEPELPEMPEFENDSSDADIFELENWGIGIRPVEDPERDDFDVDEGLYVAYVSGGSVAAEAGLPRDVVITHVDEEPVRTVDDMAEAFERLDQTDGEGLIRVQRRDGTGAFYEISPP